MTTRISSLTLVSELKRYMTRNRNDVSEKYVQISSGEKYLKRSDDPVATYEIANVETRIQRADQWADNLSKASSWELSTESILDNVKDSMQRLNELMVEANAGTLTAEDLKNIGVEVNEILESLVSELNSDFSGTPMFAGAGVRPTGHTGHWNESTQGAAPQPGDPGMPAAGGDSWENLTETEYETWFSTICEGVAGDVTTTGSDSLTCAGKDWSAVDLAGTTLKITGGAGAGQKVVVTSNDGTTLNVDPAWTTLPDATSTFEIVDYSPGWISSTGRTFEATRNEDGDIATVTYNGSVNNRQIQVSDFKTTTDYGTTGNEIVNYQLLEENDAPPPAWIATDVNLFDSIVKLRDDLMNGDAPSEETVKRVNAGLDNVITKVVENGVSQNKLELLSNNVDISRESGENWLSELGGLDIAQAVTELNEMEAALQASLQMVPRMNTMRLIDYI